MFLTKTMQEFQCDYCLKTFSKRSSIRNYFRMYHDQMYLNKTELFGKENTNTSGPLQETVRPFMKNEQDLLLENSYWQVKDTEFCNNEVSLTSKDN